MTQTANEDVARRDHAEILKSASAWCHEQRDGPIRRGDRFNAFTAITSPHDETRHSRVLATLLDPSGSHGQRALFLRLFLQTLGLTAAESANIDQGVWKVKTEVTLNNGGRIDILIEGPGWVIGVENKVGAEEGVGQLSGYAQAVRKRAASRSARSSEAHSALVFLTPRGREPYEGREHLQEQGLHSIVTCSYAALSDETPSLEGWLNQALDAIDYAAPVEYFLTQYRDLTAYLGGKPMSKNESLQLAQKLFTDSESFAAASEVAQAFLEHCVELQLWFWKELEEQLGKRVVHRENLDRDAVRDYLMGYNRRSLSMYYDTGLLWQGYRILIDVEMLGVRGLDNLTWKVMCGRSTESGNPGVARKEVANYQELDDALTGLSAGWEDSYWSFMTANLELNNGHELDLTHFTGYAQQLAGPEEEAKEVVREVVERVEQLHHSLGEKLATASQ